LRGSKWWKEEEGNRFGVECGPAHLAEAPEGKEEQKTKKWKITRAIEM
jgi:hypothetical protein